MTSPVRIVVRKEETTLRESSYFSDRYCIQNIPPVIVSSGYELYIYFRARSNDEGTPHLNRKFQGSYLTHSYGKKQMINDPQLC